MRLPLQCCALPLLALCAWAVAACSGSIEDRGGGATPGSGGLPGGASADQPAGAGAGGAAAQGSGGSGAAVACEPRLAPRLVLLSDLQHVNALRAMLGPDAVAAESEVRAETKAFAQKGVVVSTSLVHARLDLAEDAALILKLGDTGCAAPAAGAATDDACARKFVESFAQRTFRRPVTTEEVDDLMLVYDAGKATDFLTGMRLAARAALSSASFMYRTELGAAGTIPTEPRTLTTHEVASQLSFFLSDSPPDDMLRAAADSGALDAIDEVQRQVDRLLAQASVQDSVEKTLLAAWGIGNVFGVAKDPGLFPQYTQGLQASMFRETASFVHDLLFTKQAPVAELMTSRESFVDRPLADLYGVAFTGAGSEPVAVTLPDNRSGLLTQASVLTMLARTDNTSVVARGLFVRGALLCLPKIGAPPAALASQIMALLAADMTERERAEVRRTTQPCGGCHAQFDQFGLLLENYDPIGRYRTALPGGQAIDARVDLTGLASFNGEYSDAVTFGGAAAMAPELTSCIARHLLSYATTDDALAPDDCQVKAALAAAGSDRPSLPQLLRAVATSPALRMRGMEVAP